MNPLIALSMAHVKCDQLTVCEISYVHLYNSCQSCTYARDRLAFHRSIIFFPASNEIVSLCLSLYPYIDPPDQISLSLPPSLSHSPPNKETNPKTPPQHSKPQSYMFAQMRQALGIPKSTDILDHLHSLPQPAQDEAQTAIRAIERAAMVEQEAQPGLIELISYLEGRGVRMGLCTRNFEYVLCFFFGLFWFLYLMSLFAVFPSRG